MKFQYSFFDDKIGRVHILIEDEAVAGIKICNDKEFYWEDVSINPTSEILTCIMQLRSYFEGDSREFTFPYKVEIPDEDLPIYQAILMIPYGEGVDINDFSKEFENIEVKTIEKILKENPLELVVPSHRIITENDTEQIIKLRKLEEYYSDN